MGSFGHSSGTEKRREIQVHAHADGCVLAHFTSQQD